MVKKSRKTAQALVKVVSEFFPVKEKRGGGLIKIEAWEDSSGTVVKYSMAYINPAIFAEDNGRVLGYDNAHNYHHRHYMGQIYPVDDFTSYQDLVDRFQQELEAFIK